MPKRKFIQIDSEQRQEKDFTKMHVSAVVSLNISFTDIKIPFRESNFANLMVLHASHNGLKSFEDIGRETFPSLRVLNVSGNVISTLKSDMFDHMKELEILDLSDNCLSHFFFGMELTKHENIKKLFLQNNLLKTFVAGYTVASKHLSILDLSFNRLESFRSHEHIFDELFLNDNQLISIECYQRNSPRQILHAQNNLITSFESTVEFSMLNLSNNKFENLYQFSIGSANLLDLSYNQINLMSQVETASDSMDYDYDYAIGLSLSSLPLQIHVKTLNLSYNKIKTVNNVPELKRFKGLHNLNLEGNLISDIDNDKFAHEYPTLKNVNLKRNPLMDHIKKQLNFHSLFQIKYEFEDDSTTTAPPVNLLLGILPPLPTLPTEIPDTTDSTLSEDLETTDPPTSTIESTTLPSSTTEKISTTTMQIVDLPRNDAMTTQTQKGSESHTVFPWIMAILLIVSIVAGTYFIIIHKFKFKYDRNSRLMEFENVL